MRKRQSGLTLVELMVAMVAGLILVGGAFQVYLSSKQTFRAQQSLARLQENGRFAGMQLTQDLRNAGYVGCIGHITSHLDPSGTGYDDDIFDFSRPLFGWEADGTGPTDTYTINGFDPAGVAPAQWTDSEGEGLPADLADLVVPGTDVVLVRHAEVNTQATADGNTNVTAATITLDGPSGIMKQSIVMVGDCNGADVFQSTANDNAAALTKGVGAAGGNPGNLSTNWSHEYGPGMEIYSFAIDAYYIGIGAAGRPSLFRLRYGVKGTGAPFGAGNPQNIKDDTAINQELVEGIDNLQLLYGQDTNADLAVDEYVPADEVDDWQQVLAVRAAMLVSSLNPATDESRNAAFDVGGVAMTPPDDRRQRQVFSTTIALRNQLP